jgi:hypothetical protein
LKERDAGDQSVQRSEIRTVFSMASWIACSITTVAAQSVQPTEFELTGVFRSAHLHESSGVASSRSQPGVLWTHNDSGDRARIYATNLEGADLGRFRVTGADARDWEDIALGPCPHNNSDGSCLYIADTGDNAGNRSRGIIYIVAEPDVSVGTPGDEIRTRRAHELRVRYPDGPRDIEALAVTPDGDILLVTKGTRGPIVLYRVPSNKTDERSVRAATVDTLPIMPARRFGNLVTAAAVSPSGHLLVVRTYTELYFFGVERDGTWLMAGSPCWIGLRQPQGEAVDFIDESTVVLASESALGRRGGLARAVCPLGSNSGNIEAN